MVSKNTKIQKLVKRYDYVGNSEDYLCFKHSDSEEFKKIPKNFKIRYKITYTSEFEEIVQYRIQLAPIIDSSKEQLEYFEASSNKSKYKQDKIRVSENFIKNFVNKILLLKQANNVLNFVDKNGITSYCFAYSASS